MVRSVQGVTVSELLDTLDVTCTAPWTLEDSAELYKIVRAIVSDDAKVDVYTPTGKEVIVRVEYTTGVVAKRYYAVTAA